MSGAFSFRKRADYHAEDAEAQISAVPLMLSSRQNDQLPPHAEVVPVDTPRNNLLRSHQSYYGSRSITTRGFAFGECVKILVWPLIRSARVRDAGSSQMRPAFPHEGPALIEESGLQGTPVFMSWMVNSLVRVGDDGLLGKGISASVVGAAFPRTILRPRSGLHGFSRRPCKRSPATER